MEEIPHGACYTSEPVVRVRGREELSQSCPASRACAGQSSEERQRSPGRWGERSPCCWVQRPVGTLGQSPWRLAQPHQGPAERWVGAEKINLHFVSRIPLL